jgi:tetratricopeptide (TPR) repeat protein
MHDLLRHYAAELADTEETPTARDTALRRLADHYRSGVANAADVVYPHLLHVPRAVERLPTPGFPDRATALAWLAAESANLVALVRLLNTRGEHAAAWDIAHLSNGYFLLSMDTPVWLPMARAAWAAAAAWGGPHERAMAELQLGMLVSTTESVEHTARAVELARAAGWVECEAVALNNLARRHWMAGHVGDTIDQLAEALVLHRKSGRQAGEAVTLANLGAAYAERGRHEADAPSLVRARGLLDQALAVHRAIGDRRNEAETLRLLAEVHRDLDDPAPALTLAVTALGLAEQAGDTRTTINALSTIGTVQTRLGNRTAGLAYHERALTLARVHDVRHTLAQALLDQADSCVVLGRSEAAFFAAQDALLIGQQTGFWLFERRAQAVLDRVQQLVIGSSHTGRVARRTV